MSLKVSSRKLMLTFLIFGAYWFRLFTAGEGIIGKSNMFSIYALICFLLILLRPNAYNIKGKYIKLTISCFTIIVAYALVSIIWAIERSTALKGLLSYVVIALIIFEVAALVKSKDDFRFVCKLIFINVIVICVAALFECFTGHYIFALTSVEKVMYQSYAGLHSPIVQYNHPNNLATVLLLGLPFCNVYLCGQRKKHTIIFAMLAVVIFLILMAADARFSLVCLALYALLTYWRIRGGKKSHFIFLNIILAIVFVYFIFSDSISTSIGTFSFSGEARPLIWANAFHNFLGSYGLGVGVGNAHAANLLSAKYAFIGRPCHNYILEVAEELGVVGLIAWLVWYIRLFKRSGELISSAKSKESFECFEFMIIFLPMTIQQSSLSGQFSVWILFGLVLAWINLCGQDKAVDLKTKP